MKKIKEKFLQIQKKIILISVRIINWVRLLIQRILKFILLLPIKGPKQIFKLITLKKK